MNTPVPSTLTPAHLAGIIPRLGQADGRITNLTRLSGGASQEIWSFMLETAKAPQKFILRRAPLAARPADLALAIESEAIILGLAGQAGIPVPGVPYVLRPQDNLGRGFIMNLVEGETLGRRIVRDEKFQQARKIFSRQAGDILACIHAITAPPGILAVSTASDQIADLKSRHQNAGLARPVFTLALTWLAANLPPPPATPKLVHGDFRNGNLIFGPEGVRAVLDWELAHLGDPMEDLGWLCVNSWRFGAVQHPVGGLGDRETLYASYAAKSGHPVNIAAAHFWEVLCTLRWGIMCAGMVEWIRSGQDRSVERVVIARRASETEIDLMRLLAPIG